MTAIAQDDHLTARAWGRLWLSSFLGGDAPLFLLEVSVITPLTNRRISVVLLRDKLEILLCSGLMRNSSKKECKEDHSNDPNSVFTQFFAPPFIALPFVSFLAD